MTKAAFITGGSRGIGHAVATGLANQGYNIALVARSEKELDEASQQILKTAPSSKVVPLVADVCNRDQIFGAFEKATSQFGSIDVVLNNAGLFIGGSAELSEDDIRKIFEVNAFGAFWVAQAAVDHFLARKKGYLMNVSSICGVTGLPGSGAYCATKFALQGFNESLFKELVPQGIKVTAICPSWVETKMTSVADFPGNKMMRPEDIWKTVEYLLSLSPNACPREVVIECINDIK